MACLPGGRRLKARQLLHPLAILLTFISMIILFAIVFWNAPSDHVHSILEGKSGQRMWLLTVNQTLSASTSAATKRDLISLTSVLKDEKRAVAAAAEDGGLHAYGFGIWGWCQWTNTNWEGNSKCTKKIGYVVPRDADSSWDDIQTICQYFPYALTHLMSGMSIPLVLLPFLVFSYLIILLLALWYPPPIPPWPIPPKSQWSKHGVNNYKTRSAWILRDWRTQLTFFILWVLLIVWTIAAVVSAKNGVRNDQGLVAKFGYGFYGLIIAWVLFVVAQIIPMGERTLIFYKLKEGETREIKQKKRLKSKG